MLLMKDGLMIVTELTSKGMLSFARSEDWSRRLPEFREYLTKLDNMRGTDFRKTFPEMAYLMDEE